MEFGMSADENYCHGDKPKCTNNIKKRVYLRVGGGEAVANSKIHICFYAIWCIWACLQHSNSHSPTF